jgi:serine/threonine protein kinase
VAALALGSVLAATLAGRNSRGRAARRATRREAGRYVDQLVAKKYRLIGLIGRGPAGEVYAGRRLTDGLNVAVKILHRHLTEVADRLERVWRDLEAVSCLPATRIARVFDYGKADAGYHYIVIEELHGQDLASRLEREGRLALDSTIEIVDQLSSILEAAADRGVAHLNLKPRNVFLVEDDDGRPEARLLDFGIHHLQDATLAPAAALQNHGFLSPEQVVDSSGAVGPHTDVFALAAVVYLALSGEYAFPSRHPAAGNHGVVHYHPPPVSRLVPELPEAVDSVLEIALAKDPTQRYARASDFARDLRAAATGSLPGGSG